jgi:hypothetical protein
MGCAAVVQIWPGDGGNGLEVDIPGNGAKFWKML